MPDHTCTKCSSIPITGFTSVQQSELRGNTHRVYASGVGSSFSDFDSIHMARACACGWPNAAIHNLVAIKPKVVATVELTSCKGCPHRNQLEPSEPAACGFANRTAYEHMCSDFMIPSHCPLPKIQPATTSAT